MQIEEENKLTYRHSGEKERKMTVKEFYEWIVANEAEDYQLKILRDKEKSHLVEMDDDRKQVVFYSK